MRKIKKKSKKKKGSKFFKKRVKKILPNLILLVAVIIIFFIIGEIFARIFVGDILVKQFEDNGFFHYKPNQEGWAAYEKGKVKLEARINNIGARGEDVNINEVKNSNKYVFLGDSFTFGWTLKDNETIPEYFKKFMGLSDEQVINYGVGGYGHEHMIESYNYFNEFFKEKDIFIMIIMEQDFERDMSPKDKMTLRDLFWEVKRHSSFISYMHEISGPALMAIKYKLGLIEKQILWGPYFNEKQEKELLNFNNLLENKNQTLIIVFYEEEKHLKFSKNYSERGEIFCEKNNIYCITNISLIINQLDEEERYAIDGGHSSEKSNKVVAKEIANFIKKNELFLE